MVIQPEQLLESLLDLERSRQREREIRLETEALLEGLRAITEAHEQHELFQALVDAFRRVVDFDQAFILQSAGNDAMSVLGATFDAVKDTTWEIGSVFRRALSGRPVASFDVSLVPEWRQQASLADQGVVSALHIGLQGKGWEAMLIVTHTQAKHFGPSHVKKAMRFSPLAAQALLTLELRQAVIQRDRFFQLSLDAMVIFNCSGVITQQNQGWTNILGGRGINGQYANIFEFVHPEDLDNFQAAVKRLRQKEGRSIIKTRFQQQDGNYLWFSCSLALYHDELLYYVVARDITDSVLFERQLAHQAGHDSMTGLKNRAEFMACLKRTFQQHAHQPSPFFALLFLDLNKFKAINDHLGHETGDELLKAFAQTLQEAVRDGDVVSRLGGDEFTIIVDQVLSITDVEKVADRIHRQCREPYLLKGHRVTASTSIGIAVSSTAYDNEEAMLHAADLAMYRAKSNNQPYCLG